MGVAINTWGGGGRGPSQAHIDISSDGVVVVKVGTQDLGTGTRTLVAVVAADTLGLPVSAIRPEIGDTMYPISGGSGGSTTAAAISPAIRIAAVNALDALKERVAPALGVEPAALVAAGGRIQVKDSPSKGMSWREACKQLGTQPISVDGNWQPGLSSVTTTGVQFAEVTVDIETGIVKVTRVLAIQDCGLIVSRLTTRKPGLWRRDRLAQLCALRGSHPRSQHRADGESRTWSGTCSQACPTSRRSTCVWSISPTGE